ncbi:MAG: NUDIX hydrolase [Acidimicrobiales bacterium]
MDKERSSMREGRAEPVGAGALTPAATVVPVRDGEVGLEVLLLRRSTSGAFGGMWVFPGGQVDPSDIATADAHVPAGPYRGEEEEIGAARRAAVREAREEAGLALREAELVALSFWVPPPEAPRRFATWFFVAPAGPDHAVVVDEAEIREHRWMSPAAAMRARDSGEIELAPPTYMTLWWLRSHPGADAVIATAASHPPERYSVRLAFDEQRQVRATLWDGDEGFADGDLQRPGPRRRLWLDPAGWRVEIAR